MPLATVNRVKTITVSLSSDSGSDIVPIYEANELTLGQELLPGHKIVSFNCFIKNLKAFAAIRSLPEVPLPDFALEDSETDKLYKTLDIEWKSPRKQLSLYVSSDNSGWLQVGSVSLLNPYGYPFRVYNLMDLYTDNLALELGENSKIGIGVDGVGHGLLQSNDVVTVHGSYVEEFFLSYEDVAPVINVNPVIELSAELPIQLNAPIELNAPIRLSTQLPIELHAPINLSITTTGGASIAPASLLDNSTTVDNNFVFTN